MSGLHRVQTLRVECVLLESRVTVLVKNRLQANDEIDPARWELWKIIWDYPSFEELAPRTGSGEHHQDRPADHLA